MYIVYKNWFIEGCVIIENKYWQLFSHIYYMNCIGIGMGSIVLYEFYILSIPLAYIKGTESNYSWAVITYTLFVSVDLNCR